ncbi:MAG: helix-turn-helix transcriptional regulator [Clostridia bacterium]|nr:helix-turn-helix transcriptional regulator [Clostridia bacterium]
MEINFAQTIKNLRKERGNTQEELADNLGISVQAVSKWERGDGLPDIMLLPHIASFYDTTVDFLLGCDSIRKQEDIDEFVKKHQELYSQGKTAERLELCRAMQKKYPNDETVLYNLMKVLQNGYIDESFDEIVTLGERFIHSSNMEYKVGAIRGLCFSYLHKGDRKNAQKYADMLPINQDLYLHVLEGDALVEHCQNYFYKVCDFMYLYMSYLLRQCDRSGYTHEEKHSMWKTLYDIFNMIFPNQDFGFYHDRLARISFFMANDSGRAGQFDTAIEDLERMLIHIERFNEFTEISHTSLLVNKVKINKKDTSRSSEATLAQSYLRYLNNNENIFASIKDDPRFVSIKERLAVL